MESTRFDDLSRALARGTSRRRVARFFAGGVVGVLTASLAGGLRDADGRGRMPHVAARVSLQDDSAQCLVCKDICSRAIGASCKYGVKALLTAIATKCTGGNIWSKGGCAVLGAAVCYGVGEITSDDCLDICEETLRVCRPSQAPSPDETCLYGWCRDGSCRPIVGCCPDDRLCSSGSGAICCPADYPVCCPGWGADGTSFCCPPNYACDVTYGCVQQQSVVQVPLATNSCPQGNPHFHPTYPGPNGESTGLCCPEDVPGACTDRYGRGFCCPLSERCCDGYCC